MSDREAARERDTEPPGLKLPEVGGFVQLPQSWHSSAGIIQNLVEHACGGVAVIRSAKDETRANHWHKTDWHYLYVVSGEFLYSECANEHGLFPNISQTGSLRVRAGQMIFTPPGRRHQLLFTEDTVMISISKLSRQHAEHESDVVRL